MEVELFLILRLHISRSIGFFAFNKPAGLILLKKVKLLGASVTWLCSNETGVKDVQFNTLPIVKVLGKTPSEHLLLVTLITVQF